MTRRHVVLLTYGEPETANFARHLAYSWRILWDLTRLVAPIPAFVLPAIAVRRAFLRVRQWNAEEYGSPIEAITRAQAEALGRALAGLEPGESWRLHVAYEFRKPTLEQVLRAIPEGEAVEVVPMYVADSEFTHQLSRRKLAALSPPAPDASVVPALDPDVLAAISALHLQTELVRRRVSVDEDWALVLAAHGTLLHPPRPMNTGREATFAVAEGITRRVGRRFGHVTVGWLNHALGGDWTLPAADRAVRELADDGFRKVVYFPYGFVADNAESQLEGRILLRAESRLSSVIHVHCVNDSPGYVQALAHAVLAHTRATASPQVREARGT
jgi:ferrochelatase